MLSDSTDDIGTVTSVEGKYITVEINKGGGCKNCGMKGFCGTSNSPIILRFETDELYKTGDRVAVSVEPGIRLLSSLIVFGLPLIAMFGFFIVASKFFNEPVSVLISFAGMVLSFLVVRRLDKYFSKKVNFRLRGKYEDMSE
jgi:positive regulator of sigma E activity